MSEEKKFQTVENTVEPEAPITTEPKTVTEETKKKNWFVRAATTAHNYTTGWVWRKVITPSYKWAIRTVVKPAWEKTPSWVCLAVIGAGFVASAVYMPFTTLYTCLVVSSIANTFTFMEINSYVVKAKHAAK